VDEDDRLGGVYGAGLQEARLGAGDRDPAALDGGSAHAARA
jgi:hypothetical protein